MVKDQEIARESQKSTTADYYLVDVTVMVKSIGWSPNIFKRKLLSARETSQK